MTTTEWTYEQYWDCVLGPHSEFDVVQEFELRDDPVAGPGSLDDWLGHAESEAWAMGGFDGDVPEEWEDHHRRALAELKSACSSLAD